MPQKNLEEILEEFYKKFVYRDGSWKRSSLSEEVSIEPDDVKTLIIEVWAYAMRYGVEFLLDGNMHICGEDSNKCSCEISDWNLAIKECRERLLEESEKVLANLDE